MGFFSSDSKTSTTSKQVSLGAQTQEGDATVLKGSNVTTTGYGNPVSLDITKSRNAVVTVESVDFGAVAGGLALAESAALLTVENQREILGTAERLIDDNNEIFSDVVGSLNSARSGAVDSLAALIDGSTVADLKQSDVLRDAVKVLRWPLLVVAGAYTVHVFRGRGA